MDQSNFLQPDLGSITTVTVVDFNHYSVIVIVIVNVEKLHSSHQTKYTHPEYQDKP